MGKPDLWQIVLAATALTALLAFTVVIIGGARFRDDFEAGARNMLAGSSAAQRIITEADLAGLPEPVQRYLRHTGVVGKEAITSVRLEQTGVLRQAPDAAWQRLRAVEYFSVNPPAFVWLGEVSAGPLRLVAARDSYLDGRGRMLIRMLGLRTLGDAQGEEMDYSSLVRFLNEMMWFPTAYLNDNVSWEAIDAGSARVTIRDGERSASAVLHFDASGEMTNFVGERYHEVDGVWVRDTWETPMIGYAEFNGLRLPVSGEATWKTSGGDFTYIRLEVTAVEYQVQAVG